MGKLSALALKSFLLVVLLLATTTTAMEDQQLPDPSMAPVSPVAPVAVTSAPVVPVGLMPTSLSPVVPVGLMPISSAPIGLDPDETSAPVEQIPAESQAPVVSPVAITDAPATGMPVSFAPVEPDETIAPVTVSDAPVTAAPSFPPSPLPSVGPSVMPSDIPTGFPSNLPSVAPSIAGSTMPSVLPSLEPSFVPSTAAPSFGPSLEPSGAPVTFPVSPAPTLSPVSLAPVTGQPITSAPVSTAPVTLAPVTIAPVTMAPVAAFQSGDFVVRMLPANSLMTDETMEIFRETVELFLTASFGELQPPVTEVGVQVMSQLLLADETIQVAMTVEGAASDAVDITDLALLVFGLQSDEFVDLLGDTKDKYLEKITEVFPLNPNVASTSPSMIPSAMASDAPSLAPTLTSRPSDLVRVPVSDRFSIRLLSVNTRMTESNADTLKNTTELFLANNYALLGQPVDDVTIQIVGQELQTENRRRLQTLLPLEVEMVIEGNFNPDEGEAKESDDMNLSKQSRVFFDTQGDKFIDLLQSVEDVENSIYYANVNTVATVGEPGDIVTPAPTPPIDGEEPSNDGGGLAIGAIIGIALAGALVLALIAAVIFQRSRRNGAAASSSRNASTPVAGANNSSRGRERETLNLERGRSSNYDGDSQSDMQSRMGADTLGGADTMSYAYSLDHGIDPSVSSGPPSEYMSGRAAAGGAMSAVPNEIPMLDGSNSEMEAEGTRITRECFAPPGRLGIVIDTTVEGPIIHKVNPGSPLEGIVWPGDIIVAIDDVDTRALSAGDITALMAKNMNQRRKLTILSDAS